MKLSDERVKLFADDDVWATDAGTREVRSMAQELRLLREIHEVVKDPMICQDANDFSDSEEDRQAVSVKWDMLDWLLGGYKKWEDQ